MILKKSKILSMFLIVTLLISVFPCSTFASTTSSLLSDNLLAVNEVNDMISEEQIALHGHIQEIETDELNVLSFRNNDGTTTKYLFSENIRYVNSNGNICDKSNDLFLQEDDSYQNLNNDIRLSFPNDISDGIALSYKDISISMTPRISSSHNKKSVSLAQLVTNGTRISKESVKYVGVFDANSDIIYTPGFSGFKEDIILEQAPKSNKIEFYINTNNSTLNNKGTHIEILDTASDIIGIISPITVISSNNVFSDGSYLVEQLLGTNKNENTYLVTLILDDAYLSSSSVEYPITVDPSIQILSFAGNEKQIYDASLYENFLNLTTGYIQYNNVGYLTNDKYGFSRSIIRFPTLENDIKFKMIPNERLSSVYLYLSCVACTNSTTVYACQYDGVANWLESTITSGYSPNYSTPSTSKVINSGTASSPTQYSFNITSIARNWKTDLATYPNNTVHDIDYGILLRNSNESNKDYGVRFASSDASTGLPYLSYTYTESTTFSVKNVYSNNFLQNVASSNSTTATNLINGAATFIDTAFDSFGVSFTNSSTSNRTSLIDSCNSGRDAACTSTNCGSNCNSQHHRNINRYSNEIYNLTNSANQIYIAWDYAGRATLCDSTTATHESFSAMGCVTKMPNTASRGIVVPNLYWDGMNTIMIFEPSLNFASSYYASSMKLIAAHEMAHVMGIYDTYGNGANSDHNVDSSTWSCIMRSFNHSYAGSQFVTKVENGTSEPFCSYCSNLISSVIKTRYFPAS